MRRAHAWLGAIVFVLLVINVGACAYMPSSQSPQWMMITPLVIAVAARAWTARTIARASSEASANVAAADELVETEPEKAMELARSALTGGATGVARVLGWLVAARVHERIGDFAKANEAIDLASERAKKLPLEEAETILVRLRLQLAFVKAAMGDVDAATSALEAVPRHELADPISTADFARARALVAHRKRDHGAVIAIVDEELAGSKEMRPRDVALLEGLRQSSRLHLDGGNPMRVAASREEGESGDAEWARSLVEGARA